MIDLKIGPFRDIQCSLEGLKSVDVAGREAKFKELERVVKTALLSASVLAPSGSLNLEKYSLENSLSVVKATLSYDLINLEGLELIVNSIMKSILIKQGMWSSVPPSIGIGTRLLAYEVLLKWQKQIDRFLTLESRGSLKQQIDFHASLSELLELWKNSRVPLSIQTRILSILELDSLASLWFFQTWEEIKQFAKKCSSSDPNVAKKFENWLVSAENTYANVSELEFGGYYYTHSSSFPESIKLCRRVEKITISDLENLEELPNFRHFPLLKRLDIRGCGKLKMAPDLSQNPHLERFHISSCPKLKDLDLSKVNLLAQPQLKSHL